MNSISNFDSISKDNILNKDYNCKIKEKCFFEGFRLSNASLFSYFNLLYL